MDESDQPYPQYGHDPAEPPDGDSIHLRLLAERASERLEQDLMARHNSARLKRAAETGIGDVEGFSIEEQGASSIDLHRPEL